MNVAFINKQLSKIESDEAAKLKLPLSAIKAARKKIIALRAAPDERTLRNWKSLHYEKLKGDGKDKRSIKLNDQWRLIFTLNSDTDPPTVIVIFIEDYH